MSRKATKKTTSARGGKKGNSRSSRTASTDAGDQEARAESGHTPGPWTAQLDDAPFWVQSADGAAPVICDLVPRDADVFTEEDEANAHLIAAAPDLLAAVIIAQRWLANSLPVVDMEGPKPLPIIAAAIAKAEGR